MDSNQLFEDYDPDMEDVFGRNEQLKPRCITVSEEQKADPLRKPKIVLQAILVAEKLPLTLREIEARMMEEDGKVMDATKYGFSTLDDLLQSIPDFVDHKRKSDGTHVYSAKVNEANQDILELVQLQSNRGEAKRPPRSFLSTGTGRGKGAYGASFRSYTGPKMNTGEVIKGTAQNFQARGDLGLTKTADRVRNLADVLRKSRAEIGKSHPEVPGRLIVTLADLQKKFLEIYALPAWGKKMSEADLHEALDQPEYASILTFWTLRENGDIYVEESNEEAGKTDDEVPKVECAVASSPESAQELEAEDESNLSLQTIVEAQVRSKSPYISDDEYSSIGDDDSTGLLERDSTGDNMFSIGAGFGGSRPNSQKTQKANEEFSDIARKFGVTSEEEHAPSVKSNTSTVGLDLSLNSCDIGSHDVSEVETNPPRTPRQPPAMRPVDVSFSSRVIVPKNPMKELADYVKSRGSADYESLPAEDKQMVNFSKNVFKVFATQPGEMQVRLEDPNVDTSTLKYTGKDLRSPVEMDLRWMAEAAITIRRGRQYLKPVMFVPPRGILLMTPEQTINSEEESKLEKMEVVLRHYMDANCYELDRSQVRPGMQAVYIYRQEHEVRYYRVLILGRAHSTGDVMVILADLDYQYFVDVKLEDLFATPPKAGFKDITPNILFATLYGMQGLAEEEQYVMWKNMDDDPSKKMVCAVLVGEEGRVPFVDMIWRDEQGKLEWLSQIAKRRGAIMQSDQNSGHLEKSAAEALPSTASEVENVMEFIDYSLPPAKTTTVKPAESTDVAEMTSESAPVSASPTAVALSETPFSVRTLDMQSLFNAAVDEKNYAAIFGIAQFARSVLPAYCDAEEAETLIAYMVETAKKKLEMPI